MNCISIIFIAIAKESNKVWMLEQAKFMKLLLDMLIVKS
jgi:hypothetical protein